MQTPDGRYDNCVRHWHAGWQGAPARCPLAVPRLRAAYRFDDSVRTMLKLCRRLSLILLLPGLSMLAGCSTLSYYSQAVSGHFELMRARQPITALLADPATDPVLREQLETLQAARRFAVDTLQLPDNDSYSTYVATGRPYVTWNVVAADEFSVDARTWCFPIAGCVNYRGYFDESDARNYAAALQEEGPVDVIVGGASAYSTLGWFADPIYDTMLRGGDIGYVGTLFHEMAHQKLYVQDDSDFNEAFASFVEQEGIREWLIARDETARVAGYGRWLQRRKAFNALLRTTRDELSALYAGSLDPAAKRAAKQAVFAGLRSRYAQLKESWDGYAGYDRWFERELNNARLVSITTYQRYIPAFQVLFTEAGRDWPAFFTRSAELAGLPEAERHRQMEAYLRAGRSAAGVPAS